VPIVVALALAAGTPAHALESDELVLIVNAKAPEGRELAEHYAKARGVPDGRIIELDLPFPAEQMSRAAYDADVVPKVRQFITGNGLRGTVKCAVTFYGVPIRVEGRAGSPGEAEETAHLDAELARVAAEVKAEIDALEKLAAAHDPAFKPAAAPPPPGRAEPLAGARAATEAQALARRAESATDAATAAIGRIEDLGTKEGAVTELRGRTERLLGAAPATLRLAGPTVALALGNPVTRAEAEAAQEALAGVRRRVAAAEQGAGAAPGRARAAVRELVRDNLGAFQYLVLLVRQRQALEPGESQAAFDSELALLWAQPYALSRWQPNPLHYRVGNGGSGAAAAGGGGAAQGVVTVMMVTRLDGPRPDVVRRMIDTSVTVEAEGLSGRVVLDARGRSPADAYGQYDQTIRKLGQIVRTKTTLPLTIDDKEAIFQPGSATDVAIYCGWYSLRNYVRAFEFKPGAVGFHIASAEMVSLRGADERGWVANLLNDGVAATLGPVAEPYLHSFPPADEFFPLLMTGKLTLAEAYWKTNPLTSWMNTCVGDPLYSPFKAKPAIQVGDLAEELRGAAGG
jgi:uncharacterized protein (TIGR03790 family)